MSGSFESVRWNARVHRQDLGLCSHPQEFSREWSQNHHNSKRKIPSTVGSEEGGNGDTASRRFSEPNTLPTELFRPLTTFQERVCLLVGCLTSQQHASVSQGRICSDNFTCCHTEIEAADQTFHLTQSQYTDTGPTSPSADPITPGAWQGSHWSANV